MKYTNAASRHVPAVGFTLFVLAILAPHGAIAQFGTGSPVEPTEQADGPAPPRDLTGV